MPKSHGKFGNLLLHGIDAATFSKTLFCGTLNANTYIRRYVRTLHGIGNILTMYLILAWMFIG